MKMASAFMVSWNAPIPAAAQVVPGGSASTRWVNVRAVAGAAPGEPSRTFAYSGCSITPSATSWLARWAMPLSKTSSSGRMPASRIRDARATIVSGAVTLGPVRKFSDPRVRLAMSGLAAASRARTSARCSRSGSARPLVETQTTSSGHRARSSSMIGS